MPDSTALVIRLLKAAGTALVTCALSLSPDGPVYAQSASAQDSFPKSILIIPFQKQSRGVAEFGDSAAAETSRLLAKSASFKGVIWKELIADLPIYLRAPDCIVAQQGALKARLDMVMCATYEEIDRAKFVVHGVIIVIGSNKPIELPRIEATTPEDAARQVVKALEKNLIASPVR